MELHMVFFKKVYRNSRSALDYPDGLAVLAFFYEVAKFDNPAYSEITELLENITRSNHEAKFDDPPALRSIIPNDLVHYYTYNGSLTTPPCSEVVTWIDFKEAIPLSHNQVNFINKSNQVQK